MQYAIVALRPTGLGDTRPLVAALEAALRQVAAKNCSDADGLILVRLVIDKNGKVIKVETTRPDKQAVARCLADALEQLSTSTRPTSGETGTVELEVRVLRPR